MYLLEIIQKRRIYEPIFKQTWQRISTALVYPALAEGEPLQKLLFLGQVTYAAVYVSALAAGMSSSAAHCLARNQLRQFKVDKPVAKVVAHRFSGTDDVGEQAYAELLRSHLAHIQQQDLPGEQVATLMAELAERFINHSF